MSFRYTFFLPCYIVDFGVLPSVINYGWPSNKWTSPHCSKGNLISAGCIVLVKYIRNDTWDTSKMFASQLPWCYQDQYRQYPLVAEGPKGKICTKSRDCYSHEWSEVPLVTCPAPQPSLNSWTLNKGWIIIGTAWCTTIHHYSNMKPFIGHNGRNTHLVLVLLGTPRNSAKVWKLNHQKSLDFFAFENSKFATWKKRCSESWEISGFVKRWTEPSKKTRIWLNKSQIYNLIYVVYFKSFPDARWFSPNTGFSLQKHFSTSNKNTCHCHQDAVRPWAPTIK